jgi:hypothetical protein
VINEKMCSEVYAIIMASGEEYVDLVPDDFFFFFENERDPDYTPIIDHSRPLNEQGFAKETPPSQ